MFLVMLGMEWITWSNVAMVEGDIGETGLCRDGTDLSKVGKIDGSVIERYFVVAKLNQERSGAVVTDSV